MDQINQVKKRFLNLRESIPELTSWDIRATRQKLKEELESLNELFKNLANHYQHISHELKNLANHYQHISHELKKKGVSEGTLKKINITIEDCENRNIKWNERIKELNETKHPEAFKKILTDVMTLGLEVIEATEKFYDVLDRVLTETEKYHLTEILNE